MVDNEAPVPPLGTGGPEEAVLARLRALVEDPPRTLAARAPGAPNDPRVRLSAVLVLFGVLDDVPASHPSPLVPANLDILLTRRSPGLTHHPGQVSFPGGGIDETDADAAAAALREGQEETGLDPAGVEVVGQLPPVPLTVSGNMVTPVIGWWRTPSPVWAVDPLEATEVFRVPVADLVDPARRLTAVLERGGVRHAGPAFDVSGHLVWGFTAYLLSGILDALGWAERWDRSRTVRPDVD